MCKEATSFSVCKFVLNFLICFLGLTLSLFAQATPIHQITSFSGTVRLKRPSWKTSVPVAVGMAVKNGDLFEFNSGARATVVCSDTSVRNFNQQSRHMQCPVTKPVIIYNRSKISRVRNASNDPFPILITPRMTNLLNPHPIIRWKPVAGTTEYRVVVLLGNKEIWSKKVKDTSEIKYPADAPQLQAGEFYNVIIDAGENKNSAMEKAKNAGFSVLDANQVKKIQKVRAQIQNLRIPENVKQYMIANVYASWTGNNTESDAWRLTSEAIEILENLSKTNESVTVLLELGDLYLLTDLIFLAQKHYQRVLELTKASGDVLNEAAAQYALSKVYQARLNETEAMQRLKEAEKIYQAIGEPDLLKKVQDEIKALQK